LVLAVLEVGLMLLE
jgi:hypothetical protein